MSHRTRLLWSLSSMKDSCLCLLAWVFLFICLTCLAAFFHDGAGDLQHKLLGEAATNDHVAADYYRHAVSPSTWNNRQQIDFALQTFLAPMSQVFPAEDDVNKHVDDNCEILLSYLWFCHCNLHVITPFQSPSPLMLPHQVLSCTWTKPRFSTTSECATAKTTSTYVPLIIHLLNLHLARSIQLRSYQLLFKGSLAERAG